LDFFSHRIVPPKNFFQEEKLESPFNRGQFLLELVKHFGQGRVKGKKPGKQGISHGREFGAFF